MVTTSWHLVGDTLEGARAGASGSSVSSHFLMFTEASQRINNLYKTVTNFPFINKCFMYYFIVNRAPFYMVYYLLLVRDHYQHPQ